MSSLLQPIHPTSFDMVTSPAIERLEFRVLSSWIVWWEKAGPGLTGNSVLCLSQSGWFCTLPPTPPLPSCLRAWRPLYLIRPQIKGSRALLQYIDAPRLRKLEMMMLTMVMTATTTMVMMMILRLGRWELVRSGDGSAAGAAPVTESPLTLHCTV